MLFVVDILIFLFLLFLVAVGLFYSYIYYKRLKKFDIKHNKFIIIGLFLFVLTFTILISVLIEILMGIILGILFATFILAAYLKDLYDKQIIQFKSKEQKNLLKKEWLDALFVSTGITFIGTVFLILYFITQDENFSFFGLLFWIGILFIIYSIIGFYNAKKMISYQNTNK